MGRMAERCGVPHLVLLLLSLVTVAAPSWGGGFVLVGEVTQAQRDLAIGQFSETSDDHQVLAGFIGFELENSILYLGYRTEDTEFSNGVLPYQRQEATVEWHWNETTEKDNYLNASFGFFNTSYSIGPAIDEDFFGIALGAGGTKVLGSRLFLTGSFKVKLPYTDDSRFLKDSEDGRFFVGYETRAAVGIYLDSEGSLALQIGYRLQQIDFDNVFVDDDSKGPFVSVRVFIPAN